MEELRVAVTGELKKGAKGDKQKAQSKRRRKVSENGAERVLSKPPYWTRSRRKRGTSYTPRQESSGERDRSVAQLEESESRAAEYRIEWDKWELRTWGRKQHASLEFRETRSFLESVAPMLIACAATVLHFACFPSLSLILSFRLIQAARAA